MQLQAIVTPARPAVTQKIAYTGQIGDVSISAGKTLKVEFFPGGEEILNATVPDGKQWIVYVKVDIQEIDE